MALIQNFETGEGFTGNYFNVRMIDNSRNRDVLIKFYSSKENRDLEKTPVFKKYIKLYNADEIVCTEASSPTYGCVLGLNRTQIESMSASELYTYLKTKKIHVNIRGCSQVLDLSLSQDDI